MHYAEFGEDEVRRPPPPSSRVPAPPPPPRGRLIDAFLGVGVEDDDEEPTDASTPIQHAALLAAIKEYDANKWKVVGAKLGKPAKVCGSLCPLLSPWRLTVSIGV